MNIYTKALTLLLICCSAWFAGCTRKVFVESAWGDGVPHNLSYSRLLVVGLSENINGRCDFEQFLATQLRSDSVAAITSCSVIPLNDPLTIEGIEKAIVENQVDAIVVTILESGKADATSGGKNDTRGGVIYKATGYGMGYYGGYYGRYGMPTSVTYVEQQGVASITTIDLAGTLSTRVFETADATMVYELVVDASKLESRDSAFAEIS
jgi:hypothetical protein